MDSWSTAPTDLLELIFENLGNNFRDCMRFGAVCEEWRSLAAEKRAHVLPRIMAMIHDENNADKGVFFNFLSTANMCEIPLLEIQGKMCFGSNNGWLTIVDKSSAEISLLNPLTKNQILLPSISLVIQDLREKNMLLEYEALPLESSTEENRDVKNITKAIVSFSSGSDYIVTILLRNSESIPYYWSRDEKWSLCGASTNRIEDIIYHKEKVYVMNSWKFQVIDLNNPNLTKDWTYFQTADEALLYGNGQPDKTYWVESLENELLKIIRYVVYDDVYLYGWKRFSTVGFEVFMLHESTKSWVKVHDLGHQVLFLGLNEICLMATSVPECMPNSIYFTDYKPTNNWRDMGVFNMKDQSIKPLCENPPFMHKPTTWFTPNLLLLNGVKA
ncbi:F-box skip23-like protein [Thalictrum thalictroides]|uniref:F-box skip23-like protein n=1 Tax=Thalictrum thalictroides TaxID=46969 RepID=A0A7J6VVJ0_THATH|nr:F-box skip23-like protein [Thalictrum thalictroides]